MASVMAVLFYGERGKEGRERCHKTPLEGALCWRVTKGRWRVFGHLEADGTLPCCFCWFSLLSERVVVTRKEGMSFNAAVEESERFTLRSTCGLERWWAAGSSQFTKMHHGSCDR